MKISVRDGIDEITVSSRYSEKQLASAVYDALHKWLDAKIKSNLDDIVEALDISGAAVIPLETSDIYISCED